PTGARSRQDAPAALRDWGGVWALASPRLLERQQSRPKGVHLSGPSARMAPRLRRPHEVIPQGLPCVRQVVQLIPVVTLGIDSGVDGCVHASSHVSPEEQLLAVQAVVFGLSERATTHTA